MVGKIELLIHFIVTLIKLSKPRGIKAVMAENQVLKQQLVVLARGKSRSPKLTSFDRIFFGCTAFFIGEKRLQKVAIILKPATILKFHKALVNRKYRKLYSSKTKKSPGRKPLDQAVIDLIVEMKQRNPMTGYGRIAMQIYQAFGVEVSRFAVGRILRKNKDRLPSGDGPSWLTFLGYMKDSL
jgi:putative transposase